VRLLLVEDDNTVAAALSGLLKRNGFDVMHVRSGVKALQAIAWEPAGFRAVLLDPGLPDQDGYAVCGKIRELASTPVIIVTSRSDVRSRIHGLNLGADDYVVKPYDPGELLARINAVIRRTAPKDLAAGEIALNLGPVRIDLPARRVTVNGSARELTRKEFDLLVLLAQRPGLVFRFEQIISQVWGTTWAAGDWHVVDEHVDSLRAKLGMPALLESVPGIGYRAEPFAQEAGRTVRVGPLRIDKLARTVSVEGRDVRLTLKEFELLVLLTRDPGVIVRREQIISEIWHYTTWRKSDAHNVTTLVATLRAKLGMPELIETVRGSGYRCAVPAT
jgi:DNA-binding response OmpR family regulator